MKTKVEHHTVIHPNIEEVLIIDLETSSLDPHTGKIRFFGAYSYKHRKFYIIDENEPDAFHKLIDEHKVLVGYHIKEFDVPYLEANKFDVEYKIVVDLLKVLYDSTKKKHNRSIVIDIPGKGTLHDITQSYKLKHVCEALDIQTRKGEIDYALFRKPTIELTSEERRDIELYLYKDVKACKELFEYYLKVFEPFKEYVSSESIRKFNYVRSSLASYSYDAICHLSGLEPEFGIDTREEGDVYKGAVVLDIKKYHAKNVLLFDFASLYPHIIIQCNLLSPKRLAWKSEEYFNLDGEYDISSQGNIEQVLYNILLKRLEYKQQKSPKQLPLKIILNAFYGLCGNPIFKTFYNTTTSSDCCKIGRKCLEVAKEMFEQVPGCTVIYGDTDSCFVEYSDKGATIRQADMIIKQLQLHMPFPKSTWKMSVDCTIKEIWFEGKKNYVYITDDNKLKIKGLPIVKSDATELSKVLLEKLKPQIIERTNIKFSREYIKQLATDELQRDISLIARTYNVRKPSEYNTTSSIQAQIATVYGEGDHKFIANNKFGTIGKAKKYCHISDVSNITIDDIDLEKFWSEMDPFIAEKKAL